MEYTYINKTARLPANRATTLKHTHTHFHVHMLTRLLIEDGRNMKIPKCNDGAARATPAEKKIHWNNNIQIETRKETRG